MLCSNLRVQVSRRIGHQQIPWESSSLTGQFIFNRPSPTASTASSTEKRNETLYWRSVERSGTREGYRTYLQQFPDGVFSSLAKLRIEELEAVRAAQSSVPPSSFAVADAVASDVSAATPTASPGSIELALAPSAIAPGSSSQSRTRGQYQIAMLPEDGESWCLSGLFYESQVVYAVIRALNRDATVAAAYFPDGSLISYGEKLVTKDNLWRSDGLRRRPNEDRVYAYGRQMKVDAVLLLWYEARGGGVCNRIELRAFLYDVQLEKLYTAEVSADNLDDLSASLIDSLRAGRKVAREN